MEIAAKPIIFWGIYLYYLYGGKNILLKALKGTPQNEKKYNGYGYHDT